MRKKLFFIIPAAILGIAFFAFIGGQVVALLWNWLMPSLFGLREVTFWQALGLLALCRILFGGGGWGPAGPRMGRHMRGHWGRMSPEERDHFRKRMKERFGFASRDDDPASA